MIFNENVKKKQNRQKNQTCEKWNQVGLILLQTIAAAAAAAFIQLNF